MPHIIKERLDASTLDLDMRVLAGADVFDALSAERPCRAHLSCAPVVRPCRTVLPLETVFEILDKDAGIALDADCIEGLRAFKVGSMDLAA